LKVLGEKAYQIGVVEKREGNQDLVCFTEA
jgi:hypothetical protein